LILTAAVTGCRRSGEVPETAPAASDAQDVRKPPEFKTTPSGDKADVNQLLAEAIRRGEAPLPPGHPPIGGATAAPVSSTTLPPGHPPIGDAATATTATTLPAGHPPIGQANGGITFSGDTAPPQQMLDFQPPASWTAKPARAMTVAIYSLPKPSGAPDDAELAISHYPGMKGIPIERQAERWAGQFTQPDGTPGQAKQTVLDNTKYRTTLVDVSGTYHAGTMMGGDGTPQQDYRMISAIVETDQGPWFFKLTGPSQTVAAHEQDFVNMMRQVK